MQATVLADSYGGRLKMALERFAEERVKAAEIANVRELIGYEPLLARGHFNEDGDFIHQVVADTVSISEMNSTGALDRAIATDTASLREALLRLSKAIRTLGTTKNGKSLSEIGASKDSDAYAAWVELDAAQKKARATLEIAAVDKVPNAEARRRNRER